MSRNQLQARPVLRPLCKSFRYEIQPRSVRSYSTSPLAKSMDSQASPPARGSDKYTSSADHSAVLPAVAASSDSSSHCATGAGRGAFFCPAGADNCLRTGSGNCACRLVTTAFDSMCEALFSVNPVTANSSIPSRQSAALIQCH
ncbi:hypothetical protein D3C71_1805460 [compost metagenome]